MNLLNEKMINSIKSKSLDILNVLENSGVGGIMDKGGLKCLHAHLADYLVNGLNPIGEIVYKFLQWPEECHLCEEGKAEQ